MKSTFLTRLSFSVLLAAALALGSTASAQSSRPLGLVPEYNLSLPSAPRLAGTFTAPSSVDHSSEMPPVGDQGSLGSCVAFATGYAYKSFQEKQGNGWGYDTDTHIFSPSYIYNQIHASNSADGGGSSFSAAFNLLQSQGCATLAAMPYSGNTYSYTTQPTAIVREKAAQYKASSWASLPTRDYDEVRAHLAQGDLVVIGIPVYPDFDNINNDNQIYDNTTGTFRGYHAITVVGYDDSKRALKFINSWGTGWGLAGYGWIDYDLFSRQSIGSFVMTDLPEHPLTSVDTTSGPLDLGTSLPPLMKKDFTIEMWVEPGSAQEAYADIIDFNHRTNVGMVFQQNGTALNQFFFGIGNGSASAGITYQMQAKKWQHVAFQREGTTLRLYVNGALYGTQTCFSGDIYYLANSLVTVAYNANYGRHFNGTIKGLKIWNYARSPASIQSKSMSLATFAFNGSNNGIVLGGGVIPKMGNNFSIEMWVKPGSTQQTYANIIDFNHRTNVGMVIQQDANVTNKFVFGIGNGSAGPTLGYQFQSGVWQHVRFARDQAQLKLYVNETLVATAPCFTGDIYFLSNSTVTVGYNANYGRYFNGSIYDLRLSF